MTSKPLTIRFYTAAATVSGTLETYTASSVATAWNNAMSAALAELDGVELVNSNIVLVSNAYVLVTVGVKGTPTV